jgi:WS/DGAT/MGAT family acyltransferase
MDSMFLYAENNRAPLELGCLQIYDPSTAPRGEVRFKEILATFHDRLDRCDIFRQKLVEVPLSLDHPYWVLDEDIDLEYHVRHISLPRPGDWPTLMAQIARLQARQLDHSRPLWIAHIIEGLDNVPGLKPGCFAMYMKVHHAAMDGVTSRELSAAIHDMAPYQADAAAYEPTFHVQHEDNEPSPWNLLARMPLNTTIRMMRLGFSLVRVLPGVARMSMSTNGRRRPVPLTVFNADRVSPNRVIDGRFFDLADFKRIRAAEPGTTINDAALTVVSGALRRYLAAQNVLPGDSLVAGCPINVGTEQDAEAGRGNLLGLMMTSLHTEIEDPAERLRAVHESAQDAKAWVEAIGSKAMTGIPMNLPAPLARSLYPVLAELAVRAKRLPYNTMISNVVGIRKPIYLAGAKLVKMLAAGPVIDGSGIFHTVFSYNGEVSIGFTACRQMLPDPAFYADCIGESFEDLKNATLGRQRRPARKRAKSEAKGRQGTGKKPASKKAPAKRKTKRPANGTNRTSRSVG